MHQAVVAPAQQHQVVHGSLVAIMISNWAARGEVRTALRDTLQVHPCKLFVDILSPKVSQRATHLPLDIQCALIEDCGSNQWPERPLIAIGRSDPR
jgi:hypothetical protein